MKKKKKQCCSLKPKCDDNKMYYNEHDLYCTPVTQCKKNDTCKKTMKKYMDCGCENYEYMSVEDCEELADKAEHLFEKALECECKAKNAFDQAKECEKLSKVLSAKANDLMNKAKNNEKEANMAQCKAKELMEKSQVLSQEAKCLYKKAEEIESQAKCNCEKAKDLYDKAQEYNKNAKCLYSKALKYDEKALKCFKLAENKIKEYEHKSMKCKELIKKCNNKLNDCEIEHKSKGYVDCEVNEKNHTKNHKCCNKKHKEEYCYLDYEVDNCEEYYDNDCIDYMKCDCTYVSPVYDMCNMHHMGEFSDEYPSFDMPYMNPYKDKCQDVNDMWMYYYMNMKNMMDNMYKPRYF